MRELLRRFSALVLMCAGFAALPTAGTTTALALVAAAMVLYVAIPAVAGPQSALVYERLPSVYGPDLLAFLLVSVFFALPFWARAGEPYMWEGVGPLVHPAALLTWPLALVAAAIFWFSARYAAFWLVIEDGGLRVHRLNGTQFIPFSTIVRVKAFRHGLPRWLRWLTPLLVAMGKPGAAGAILVARDLTGVSLVLTNGDAIDIANEAFEDNLHRVLDALHAHGVAFAPELQNIR